MADISNPATVEAYTARELTRQINNIADRVNDLADTIRRQAGEVARVGAGPGRDTYAQVVARIVNEVANTLPNLGLGSLSTAAADADIARTKGE